MSTTTVTTELDHPYWTITACTAPLLVQSVILWAVTGTVIVGLTATVAWAALVLCLQYRPTPIDNTPRPKRAKPTMTTPPKPQRRQPRRELVGATAATVVPAQTLDRQGGKHRR